MRWDALSKGKWLELRATVSEGQSVKSSYMYCETVWSRL